MTPIAPHITAFLRQRLIEERNASRNTCESYAYAFKLLFEFAAQRLKTSPAKLCFEQIDVTLVADFLTHHREYTTVPDPYYGDYSDFELVITILEDACQELLDSIIGEG